MKFVILLIAIFFLFASCSNKEAEENKEGAQRPLFNLAKPSEGVELLCETFDKLSDTQLSDKAYESLQIQIEAIYIGLTFGVNAGFYTEDELLQIAASLDCVI